jgi:hypothetical protein
MKEPNMSSASEPINFTEKSLTNRGAVTVMTPSRARGPQRSFTSAAATMKQTAARAIMAALLIASLLTAAISFAAVAAAKGQEGGMVCTGTQMTSGTCVPTALQATPIGSVPLGCKPSGADTVACGRLGSHEPAAAAAQSAGSAANGPSQAPATPAGKHSGATADAKPQASRHAAR